MQSIYLSIYLGIVVFVTLVSYFFPGISARFFSYISPTTIVGALSLFMCFTKIRIENRFVNWCGISCFAVFLMHVSPSTLWHFKNSFIYLHNNYSTFVFWFLTFIILMIIFMVSILTDKLRIMLWESLYNKFFEKKKKLLND